MGRIIRACAELEDILTLFLCELADIGEDQASLLLARMAVSKKLEIAGAFAKMKGGTQEEKFKGAFEHDTFKDILKARNVIAHGVLLGRNDAGEISFRTAEMDGSSDACVRWVVISYHPDGFSTIASAAEEAPSRLEAMLNVKALREKRRSQSLLPHSKAQPKREPSAKPRSRP